MRSVAATGGGARPLGRYQRLRRLVLFLMLALATTILLFCSSWTPEGEFHEFLEAFGLSLIGVAVMGRLWCTLYIGGRKNAELVARGPYSLSRNPLYFFSAIGAMGVGAQTGSALVALFFAAVTVIAFHVVINREEEFLRQEFGAAFNAYCRRVPRFFPRFSGYDGKDMVTVDPARLYSTFFDGLVFFAAIPAFEGIEWLQQSGVLPVVLRLP